MTQDEFEAMAIKTQNYKSWQGNINWLTDKLKTMDNHSEKCFIGFVGNSGTVDIPSDIQAEFRAWFRMKMEELIQSNKKAMDEL